MQDQLYCPECGTPVTKEDKECPACGYNLQEWMQLKGITETPPHQPTTTELLKEAITALIRPTPMKNPPSSNMFLNRTQKNMKGYTLSATALLLTGLIMSYGGRWLTYIGITIAGYAAPIILLIYIIHSDRYEQEPLALIAYCFGWGAFSAILAGILNATITTPYLGPGGAGLIEEPIKIIGVYWIARNTRLRNEFNNHLDGMVYGAAAGAGFAGIENFWYITQMITHGAYPPHTGILIRSFTAVMHIAWSSMAARSLGLAKATRGTITPEDLIPGTLVSAALHFLWNTTPTLISLIIIFPLTLNSLNQMIKVALQDEKNWGYDHFPPDEMTPQ